MVGLGASETEFEINGEVNMNDLYDVCVSATKITDKHQVYMYYVRGCSFFWNLWSCGASVS